MNNVKNFNQFINEIKKSDYILDRINKNGMDNITSSELDFLNDLSKGKVSDYEIDPEELDKEMSWKDRVLTIVKTNSEDEKIISLIDFLNYMFNINVRNNLKVAFFIEFEKYVELVQSEINVDDSIKKQLDSVINKWNNYVDEHGRVLFGSYSDHSLEDFFIKLIEYCTNIITIEYVTKVLSLLKNTWENNPTCKRFFKSEEWQNILKRWKNKLEKIK